MDEHVRRVTRPLLDAWNLFEAGDDSFTLLDLSRLAAQAAEALDNSVHGIPIVLDRAAGDLEYAYYTNEGEEHLREARRILQPVVESLADD
jgi:hypothetical protein